MSWSILTTGLLSLLVIGQYCVAQKVVVFHNIATTNLKDNVPLGPVITLACSAQQFPSGSVVLSRQWQYQGKILSDSAELVDADPERFEAEMAGSIQHRLHIQNAVKADEGVYTCSLSYKITPTSPTEVIEMTYDLPVETYLPSFDYPQCSTSQNKVTSGRNITLTCTIDETTSPVNLVLSLLRQDGTLIFDSSPMVTRAVTNYDHDATFVCTMTSDTFQTLRRTCSAEPLTVIPGPLTALPGQVTAIPGQGTAIPGQVTAIPGQVTVIPGPCNGGIAVLGGYSATTIIIPCLLSLLSWL